MSLDNGQNGVNVAQLVGEVPGQKPVIALTHHMIMRQE